MIEYDDGLLDMLVPVYKIEILHPEEYVRGPLHSRKNNDSRVMKLIRKILADDNDQWVGRFCVGESHYCDENGENKVDKMGFYTHRKDVLLFDDANTAFAVRMTFT